VTWILQRAAQIPSLLSVGLYAGASTNSPSLGAVQQVLREVPAIAADARRLPALGLALAYPVGILGTIFVMLATRWLFRIHVPEEVRALEQQKSSDIAPVTAMNVEVQNPALSGKRLDQIPGWNRSGVVVSRIWNGMELHLASPQTAVFPGNVLLVVGSKPQLNDFRAAVGREAEIDLRTLPGPITSQRVVVTNKRAVGKRLDDFESLRRFGVTLTRVMRGGHELTAWRSVRLQFGDTVLMVGEPDAIQEASRELGNSPHHLNLPQIMPMFVGIALGVVIGAIPLYVPGLPAPVRLGMAGGPLIVAMILARIGRIGPAVWYLPVSANFLLRDFGLILFLACVGLRAGEPFFAALSHGIGWYWMLCAAAVTVIPLLAGAVIGRVVYRLNYLSLCGFLAGSMNSPTLAFANSIAASDEPAIAFATVYPLVMLLRIFTAQLLTLIVLRS